MIEASVGALYGVGAARMRAFAKLGVHTVEDVLHHYPRAYEYRGNIKQLRECDGEGKSAVILTVATAPRVHMIKRGMSLLKFRATEDGTGTKFIMDGISAVNWSTDYYVRVVDADGKTVSDTLCYSVAAYYGRMIDSDAATYRLKALLSNLMAFHETVAAAD